MNSIKSKAFCQVLCNMLYSSQHNQARTAIIFKRQYEVPLVKLDERLDSRRLRERHQVYDIIENENLKPLPPIKCVLTRHVDGVGVEGEIVTVRRNFFRNRLLPTGAAVYASPENIAYYSSKQPKVKRTLHALQTFRLLCGINLKIPMNTSVDWVLRSCHVKIAFRRIGVYVDNAEAITLPDEPITNKHDVQQPFTVKVKINGLDEAEVSCYILPISNDPSIRETLPKPPEIPTYKNRADVEKELIDKGIYHGTVDLETNKQ